jgi:hypothetical protein
MAKHHIGRSLSVRAKETAMPSMLMPIVSILLLLVLEFSHSVMASNEPCSLLTVEQVSSALGVSMAAGKPLSSKGCVWDEAGKKTGKRVFLNILTAQAFASGKTPVPETEKPAVTGLGDEAYYKYFAQPRYEKMKVVDLDVKKGATVLGIQVWGLPLEEAKAKAKLLTLDALSKL